MADAARQDASRRIVESLVGATGHPDHVVAAARACALRALEAVADSLNDKLAFPVALEVETVEVRRLAEAKPADATGTAMMVAGAANAKDALILVLDGATLSLLVNAFFGGDADQAAQPIAREPSPIEADVAALAFDSLARVINGEGPRAFGLRFPLPAPLTGKALDKQVLRDGPGVRVVFSLATPGARGQLEMWMPQRVLLESRGDNAQPAPGDEKAGRRWRERFNEEVMRSKVGLEARVPLDTMTLGQVAELAVGQVIPLPEGAQGETRLVARGNTVFVCEFGKLGQNYTVRIRHPFDAGKEFIEGLMSA